MAVEKITNQLLYVPFNHDYCVDKKISDLLTEEEFFENCFLKPNFEREIEELVAMSSDEIKAFEIDLTKEELIKKYEKKVREEQALNAWMDSNQNNIYCIKGDAGTGKSTFLHYLKYRSRNTKMMWSIVDIQRAVHEISILGNPVYIPKFNSLYNKGISAIIISIIETIFCISSKNKVDFEDSFKNLVLICDNYRMLYEDCFPNKEVMKFFKGLSLCLNNNSENTKDVCISGGEYCSDFFIKLFEDYKGKYNILFSIYVELFIYIIRCKNCDMRHMVAFDNFERFIGTEEIYSAQLTEFVGTLRNIQNSISYNNPELSNYFQIMIFMRNTSVRMFTPLQIADFFPHYLDLSEWFQVSKIIDKKIAWYNDKNIEINYSKRLEEILNDIGGCEDTFRGLRSKLNMLFNNNKRVIVKFLTQVLVGSINQNSLIQYDNFWNNIYNITPSYARFAARTIIFRLVLNELRSDGFFKHIIAQKTDKEKVSLGYARKILSILYDYRLQNDDSYMEFANIIRKLYNHVPNAEVQYFNSNNNKKRLTIAQILFFMNYYDTRTDNWLQFVDIQYNIPQLGRIRIQSYQELKELIDNHYENIKVKITSAGIAYLYYVVYSFEYFSCKSIYAERKNREFGSNDLPPLLCTIPSLEEIINTDINSLTCVKVIHSVSLEAIGCIEKMNEDANNILFRNSLGDEYIYHKERIINSHTGYISNFIFCLKEIYKKQLSSDINFANKFNKMINKIESIKDTYFTYQ